MRTAAIQAPSIVRRLLLPAVAAAALLFGMVATERTASAQVVGVEVIPPSPGYGFEWAPGYWGYGPGYARSWYAGRWAHPAYWGGGRRGGGWGHAGRGGGWGRGGGGRGHGGGHGRR